jgi:hypothetical protein
MMNDCGCDKRAVWISDRVGLPAQHVHDFVVGFSANLATVVIVALIVWSIKRGKS